MSPVVREDKAGENKEGNSRRHMMAPSERGFHTHTARQRQWSKNRKCLEATVSKASCLDLLAVAMASFGLYSPPIDRPGNIHLSIYAGKVVNTEDNQVQSPFLESVQNPHTGPVRSHTQG